MIAFIVKVIEFLLNYNYFYLMVGFTCRNVARQMGEILDLISEYLHGMLGGDFPLVAPDNPFSSHIR